jgi:diacylglycerol kinase
MIKFSRLLKSFQYAVRGIADVFKQEQNFKIHVFVAVIVIAAGFYFQVKIWEWLAIIGIISMVLILEMLNTVFERVVDILKPRTHVYAKQIKNIMSGVVLIVAILAVITGFIIFIPHIF